MISPKKKLLLLHSSNDLYGASKIFLQLIDLLTKNGFDVHVILPEKGMLDDFLIKKDITVSYHELGVLRKKYLNPLGLINRLATNIKAIKFLSNYIKDHSIDLVYTNTSTILCGGIAAKKNDVPSLFHIHEIPTGNKLYEFLSGKIINWYSSKVLTVSNSVKKHWLKYIDDKKIERIYNGIIFSKTDSLIKLERDQDDFVITSVARINPLQGIHRYLIDIADELIKKSTKFKFLIVGDTLSSYVSYEKSVKQKVKDLGLENQIKFLGFRDDVSSILKQSDLFIHPAISPDPLPTVLFESLHNDLPSVATNLGGAIEILDNGNNGLLIPYNDPKKAADLINEYCANTKLQKKHLENSKKNFKINFSPESFNKNILKEVNNLL